MPVFCAVYECSNRPNREKTRSFHRVQKCVVHKGKSQEIDWKMQQKVACKTKSAVDRNRSPTAMTSCANNLLNEPSRGSDDGWGSSLFKKLTGRGGHHRVIHCASGMAICFPHEAASLVACWRACILIGLICSTIGWCWLILKKAKNRPIDRSTSNNMLSNVKIYKL